MVHFELLTFECFHRHASNHNDLNLVIVKSGSFGCEPHFQSWKRIKPTEHIALFNAWISTYYDVHRLLYPLIKSFNLNQIIWLLSRNSNKSAYGSSIYHSCGKHCGWIFQFRNQLQAQQKLMMKMKYLKLIHMRISLLSCLEHEELFWVKKSADKFSQSHYFFNFTRKLN